MKSIIAIGIPLSGNIRKPGGQVIDPLGYDPAWNPACRTSLPPQ